MLQPLQTHLTLHENLGSQFHILKPSSSRGRKTWLFPSNTSHSSLLTRISNGLFPNLIHAKIGSSTLSVGSSIIASPVIAPRALHSPINEYCCPSLRITKGTVAPNKIQISSPIRAW